MKIENKVIIDRLLEEYKDDPEVLEEIKGLADGQTNRENSISYQ